MPHPIPHLLATFRGLVRDRLPGQLVIQMTEHCNARCPQCGMRVENAIPRHKLTKDQINAYLFRAAKQNVRAVSFTGGEPFLDTDNLIAAIMQAKKRGIPWIRTGTNGFFLRRHQAPDFKERIQRLADALLTAGLRNLWISIDSADPACHEKLRGLPGVVAGMEKALPIFHGAGLYPAANLGINRYLGGMEKKEPDIEDQEAFTTWYAKGFDRFFSAVTQMGFSTVNCCYPMSLSPAQTDLSGIYAANSPHRMVRFTHLEKQLVFQALKTVIPDHRQNIRIFTPLSSLETLIRQYQGEETLPAPCRGGRDFFFVAAASGAFFPCGFRGQEAQPVTEFPPASPPKADCIRCDWECFRDPSELFSPACDLLHRPGTFFRKIIRDAPFRLLWKTDLQYYAACDFFDGTKPPDRKKLAAFHRG